MIEMNVTLTEQFTGTAYVQNYRERAETEEHENLQTRIGFKTFTKVAARHGSSTVRIHRISYCTFVQFKETLVDTS